MAEIAAVIFDMYETLVRNSTALWIKTFDEICEVQRIPLSGQALWDRWKPIELKFRQDRQDSSYRFKSYRQAWEDCFEHVFWDFASGDPVDAAQRSVRDQGRRELYPESAGVITKLRQASRFRLGLLSNADIDALGPLVTLHGLEFDAVVCSEGAQAYKPDAEAFKQVAKTLNVREEECLYVGDTQLDDVQGARDAGMKTVWVNRRRARRNPALSAPDHEVQDLNGVLDVLGVSL